MNLNVLPKKATVGTGVIGVVFTLVVGFLLNTFFLMLAEGIVWHTFHVLKPLGYTATMPVTIAVWLVRAVLFGKLAQ